jgi:hypothetical protein
MEAVTKAKIGSMSVEEHESFIREAVMNDPYAYDFLCRITEALRVYDNLIDKDKPVTETEIDQVFPDLMFDLSKNKFFRAYRDVLEAQIFVSWNAWKDANEFQKSDNPAKIQCAWFIRNYCNELVPLCAWLIGGRNHARKISIKLREGYLGDWPNF